MRRFAVAVALASALGALGCAKQERDPRPIEGSWFADVAGVGDDGHSGFAVVSILRDGRTRANVTLTGGSGGGVHPWHVHEGSCDGPIVGPESAYPVLRPDASGNASAVATLDVRLGGDKDYYVNIHQSPDDPAVVGCGKLVSNL